MQKNERGTVSKYTKNPLICKGSGSQNQLEESDRQGTGKNLRLVMGSKQTLNATELVHGGDNLAKKWD